MRVIVKLIELLDEICPAQFVPHHIKLFGDGSGSLYDGDDRYIANFSDSKSLIKVLIDRLVFYSGEFQEED